MTSEREGGPPKARAAPDRDEDPRVYEALGRAIKTARTERGLERKDLAGATRLSYAYLSDIESGRRRPSSKAIFAIARALDMSPSELMLWTEQLTHRIASEEAAEVVPSAPANVPAPELDSRVTGRAELQRRSWFASEGARSQPALAAPLRAGGGRSDQASDPHARLRLELECVVEDLGPEDLELVLELARRLSREHPSLG